MASSPMLRRRSFLMLGAVATLSGCGLRIGTPEERMQAEAEESTRGRIATLLELIIDDAHAEERRILSEAIGPTWAPDNEISAADYDPLTFDESMQKIVDLVLRDINTLGGPQTAVIVDVAVAASNLVVDWRPPQQRFEKLPALDIPRWVKPRVPQDPEDTSLHNFAQAAYQASYGYSKVALIYGTESPERARAAARMEELASAAGDANALLKRLKMEQAANRPGWKLPITPTDTASARALAHDLEDIIAASLFDVFQDPRAVPLAARELKASSDARTAWDGTQVMRYKGSVK